MKPRPLLVPLAAALLLASACGSGSGAPGPSVLLPAAGALTPDDYSFRVVDDAPPEREPGFDIVGPVWDLRGPAPPEGELLTIEIPAPTGLPPDVDPSQLKIASFHAAVGDGIPYWVMAEAVMHDRRRGTLSTQARGVGLIAAVAPNDYWSTTLSRDGRYRIHFVSDPQSDRAAEPGYVALLIDELEDARQWIVDSGYPEPTDTFGGPQPVYLVPLIGGPGLTEPSILGSVTKLDSQLFRSPDTIPGAVTHELFHLSQRRAMFDMLPERTWIREATAEYVAVQRLGISAARPNIDTSCDNYMRSVVDTRGINEYHNWTFVAFLEYLQPGFVKRFFESADGPGDGVDTLREVAGLPLNRLLAEYAGSYRLLQDYLPDAEISCPTPISIDMQALDGRAYSVPPLAGLVITADVETPRQVTLTIEYTGDPEVVLWGLSDDLRDPLQPTETGSPGLYIYELDCLEISAPGSAPLDHIPMVFGTAEDPAELKITAALGEKC